MSREVAENLKRRFMKAMFVSCFYPSSINIFFHWFEYRMIREGYDSVSFVPEFLNTLKHIGYTITVSQERSSEPAYMLCQLSLDHSKPNENWIANLKLKYGMNTGSLTGLPSPEDFRIRMA